MVEQFAVDLAFRGEAGAHRSLCILAIGFQAGHGILHGAEQVLHDR